MRFFFELNANSHNEHVTPFALTIKKEEAKEKEIEGRIKDTIRSILRHFVHKPATRSKSEKTRCDIAHCRRKDGALRQTMYEAFFGRKFQPPGTKQSGRVSKRPEGIGQASKQPARVFDWIADRVGKRTRTVEAGGEELSALGRLGLGLFGRLLRGLLYHIGETDAL